MNYIALDHFCKSPFILENRIEIKIWILDTLLAERHVSRFFQMTGQENMIMLSHVYHLSVNVSICDHLCLY